MSYIQALILAIIEGITEFLPISSTGHMIIASSAMHIASDDFVKLFTVCIQLGAILSVVILYWKRFFQTLDFYFKLLAAFIPTMIMGLLFSDAIDKLLENVLVVGITLLLGGIILLFVDKWFSATAEDPAGNKVSYKNAVIIGLVQSIAMIPGVSRSAATIVGGLARGLNRKTAAEFSFFLAIPTMFGATVKKLYEYFKHTGFKFEPGQLNILIFGNVIAFIVALLAIRFFIGFLQKHGFRLFGYYRIIVGAIILILYFAGHELAII